MWTKSPKVLMGDTSEHQGQDLEINREVPVAEETTGPDVEDTVQNGPSGNTSIRSYNPKSG